MAAGEYDLCPFTWASCVALPVGWGFAGARGEAGGPEDGSGENRGRRRRSPVNCTGEHRLPGGNGLVWAAQH